MCQFVSEFVYVNYGSVLFWEFVLNKVKLQFFFKLIFEFKLFESKISNFVEVNVSIVFEITKVATWCVVQY